MTKYQFKRFHVSGINGSAEQQKAYEAGYDSLMCWAEGCPRWKPCPVHGREREYSREDELEREEARQLAFVFSDDDGDYEAPE